MKALFCLFLGFFIFGCTSNTTQPNPITAIGCSAETAITSALAASVQTTLSCTNLTAIQGDILNILGPANLCAKVVVPPASILNPKKAKGAIGSILCPSAVSAALGLVSTRIPAAWGCNPNKDASSLSAVLIVACNNVVGI